MKTPHEKAVEQAEECSNYYEMFLGDEGQHMALGLFMAKQWRRMLKEKKPDLEEVRLFSLVLNREDGRGSCGGSQWHFMALAVSWWLETLKSTNEEQVK